jgi:hypothetical protein
VQQIEVGMCSQSTTAESLPQHIVGDLIHDRECSFSFGVGDLIHGATENVPFHSVQKIRPGKYTSMNMNSKQMSHI